MELMKVNSGACIAARLGAGCSLAGLTGRRCSPAQPCNRNQATHEETVMNALTRWNPLKTIARLDPTGEFEDLIRGFSGMPGLREVGSSPEIRMDVSEDDKTYRIRAEIPGVDKDDIQIDVNSNRVAITAEVKRESTTGKGETELCTERFYGKARRAFVLPEDVESGKAAAHYENGILSVTLPKKPNGEGRRLKIH
jgi:HSP20 family protein